MFLRQTKLLRTVRTTVVTREGGGFHGHRRSIPRDHVPGAARHRHPRGARGAAAASRRGILGRRRHLDRALHLARVARARGRAALEAGLAVRLPRGAHPARRQLHRLRHRRPVVHRHAHGTRRDQGVPQRLPAPRPPAQGLRRPLQRDPLPVPRVRLGARRRARRRAGAVGLPPRRPTTRSRLPEAKVGTWAGFVFINPDPERRAARGVPRRARRRTSSAGTSATATSRPTSPR